MTTAHHVKAARHAIPGTGIKKGDSYYWWKFYRCGKQYSTTPPTRSQLTRSPFYSALYEIEDTMQAADEDYESARDTAVEELENLKDETQEKYDNMPPSLQEGDTGQLLQERVEGLDNIISELQALSLDGDSDEVREELHAVAFEI